MGADYVVHGGVRRDFLQLSCMSPPTLSSVVPPDVRAVFLGVAVKPRSPSAALSLVTSPSHPPTCRILSL